MKAFSANVRRTLLWVLPITFWLVFFVWYTDFGGPLTTEEIDEAMAILDARDVEPEWRAAVLEFLKNDTGRQFLMVNNVDMTETPPPMEGFSADATAEDYVAHYMEHMIPELFSRACHPVFMGNGLGFGADIAGIDGADGWDSAVLFRYRSRRSFLEIVTHPEIGARHEFKLAAMTKTIAYPVEPIFYLGDLRLQLFLGLGLITALIDIFVYGRSRPGRPVREEVES